MKINLTKKQYWNLIRATYMADWMANAICEADMKQDDGIKEIRDYIFSFAKEMGCEDFVEYSGDMGKYYATLDLDDEPSIRSLIERYDEHTFWDEVAEHLGERDFFRKYSKKERERMTDEEHFIKMMECIIAWEKECEENGIERLEITKQAKDYGIMYE